MVSSIIELYIGGECMLSDVEMWREFGKGIIICPFKPNNEIEEKLNNEFRSNIDSASIYVTASNVGWHFAKSDTVDAGKRLKVSLDNKSLIIPPKEWAVLCSEEAIYLDNRFSGTCYGKVTVALKGLRQIAGPLKPGSCGRLLLVVHNHTSEDFVVSVGSQIAVVTFHRLGSKPSIKTDFETSRKVIMKNLGFDVDVFDVGFADDTSYLRPYPKEKAKEYMKDDIKKHKKQIKENKKLYGYKYIGDYIPFNGLTAFLTITVIVSSVIIACSFLPSLSQFADVMRYFGATVLGGIILAVFGRSIDFRK